MTKVKICGLIDQQMVEEVAKLQPDFIGFVFAKSKREVTPEKVYQMTKNLPSEIKKVGVFVSPTKEQIQKAVEIAGIDFIQVHGEFPKFNLPRPSIQAKSVKGSINYQTTADFLLLDAPPKKYYGGNGETFAWQEVEVARLPKEELFIAGGLTPENVKEALAYFQPYAVDVSSGVETDGKKDLTKIRQFIHQVKEFDYVSTTK